MFASSLLRCTVVAAVLTLGQAGGDHDTPAPAPAPKTHHVNWVIPGSHAHGNGSAQDHGSDQVGAGKTMSMTVGDTAHFMWKNQTHQLNQMADEKHLTSCDFAGSTALVADTKTGSYAFKPTAVGTTYFSCKTSGHCAAGQKIIIAVTAKPAVSAASMSHSRFGSIVCSMALFAQLFSWGN